MLSISKEVQLIITTKYCATIVIRAYFIYGLSHKLYMLLSITNNDIYFIDRGPLKEGCPIHTWAQA